MSQGKHPDAMVWYDSTYRKAREEVEELEYMNSTWHIAEKHPKGYKIIHGSHYCAVRREY